MNSAAAHEPGPAPAPDPGPAYAVKLPLFEGPLDLLLHLIKINELEVTDLPIARIADQYVEYLELLRELDLDVAGEYLVMAATLAWIKSRLLLPPEGEEESEEEGDPRAELVARLLEYQRFKEAAGALAERTRLGRDVFAARTPGPARPPEAEREVEVGLLELLEAFRRVLRDAPRAPHPHELEAESVSVRERMLEVMRALEASESVAFEALLADASGAPWRRPLLVATFLAILELARLAAVRLYQGVDARGVPSGPIRLRRATLSSADWQAKIAEIM